MLPSTISSKISPLSYVHNLKGFPDSLAHWLLPNPSKTRFPVTCQSCIVQNLVKSLRFSAKSQFVYWLLKPMFLLSIFAFFRIGDLPVRSLVSPSPVLQHHTMTVHPKRYFLLSMSPFQHKSTKRTVPLSISPQSHSLCPVKPMLSYFKVRGSGPSPFVFLSEWITHYSQLLQQAAALDGQVVGFKPQPLQRSQFPNWCCHLGSFHRCSCGQNATNGSLAIHRV